MTLPAATGAANKGKKSVFKLLKQIDTIDLAPLDVEIADIKAEIVKLETAISGLESKRQAILTLRGEKPKAEQHDSGLPMIQRIKDYLALAGTAKPYTVAADLNTSNSRILHELRNNGDTFEQVAGGWRLRNGKHEDAFA